MQPIERDWASSKAFLGLLVNEVVFLATVHASCFEIIKLWSSKVQMGKKDEHPNLLVEDIDHTIHNVVFKSLVLSVWWFINYINF